MDDLLYSGYMGIFPEVLAHGVEEVEQLVPALDQVIRSNSVKFTVLALGAFLILTILSILLKSKTGRIKYALYILFVVVALSNTIYLAGSTIYLNQQSTTGGPIHYHADFEIWNCGVKVEIADPEVLSNKVGTEVIHEHNDDRIHIEGVLLDSHDAAVSHFFELIGGELHNDHISIPTDNGIVSLQTGQTCSDRTAAALQVFVFKSQGKTFSQTKLIDPESYIISPHSNVPPGDCILIEFAPFKEKTDKLCNFYKVAVQKGEIYER